MEVDGGGEEFVIWPTWGNVEDVVGIFNLDEHIGSGVFGEVFHGGTNGWCCGFISGEHDVREPCFRGPRATRSEEAHLIPNGCLGGPWTREAFGAMDDEVNIERSS